MRFASLSDGKNGSATAFGVLLCSEKTIAPLYIESLYSCERSAGADSFSTGFCVEWLLGCNYGGVFGFHELFGLCRMFRCGFAAHVHDLLKPRAVVCPLALVAMSIFSICHWKESAANRVGIHKRRLQNINNLKKHLNQRSKAPTPSPINTLKLLEAAVQFWDQVFFAQDNAIVINFLQL